MAAYADDQDGSSAASGPQAGDRLELTIHELGYGGVGVGRHATGLICLVPRTLPGEVVVGEVVRRKPRLAQLALRGVLQRSAQRVDPPCAHFATCGGCHLQHLAYQDQLVAKQEVLTRNLVRALGPDVARAVRAVEPAPDPLGYRNRSLYHAVRGELGFVDPLTASVVGIERCVVAQPAGQALQREVQAWLRGAGACLAPALLDVLVRTGRGGAMCVLVVAAEELPAATVQSWLDGAATPGGAALRALAAALAPAGLWLSCKPRGRMAMFGDGFRHVGGPRHLIEGVGGFELTLSPASFAQANPAVAALLYARAVAALAPASTDAVLDLYCGSGALAFHLARRAAQVYAVDADHGALEDARRSAARNAIDNVTWRAGKCETIVTRLVRAGTRFPRATVNPPRTGLHGDLPAQLVRLGVARLAYVSCSPPTLARDLARLQAQGFAVQEIQPFDMFPQTYHLETLTLLAR